MKKLILLTLLFLSSVTLLTAQSYTKGSITLSNGEKQEGRIAINYKQNVILVKNNYKAKTYTFNQVTSAEIRGEVFTKQQLGNNSYFASSLVRGKASLYQISDLEYLITNDDDFSKIINLDNRRSQITGILSVIFSDCNEIRTSLNNVDEYNKPRLIRNVKDYNNCSHSTFAPTAKEVEAAATHNTDAASFYVGAGVGSNAITFFDTGDSQSTVAAQFQLGVIASPSFLKRLQGNLYFSLEGNAAFAGDTDFSNAPRATNFKQTTFRLLVGLEYVFNKNSSFKPFIGVSAGPTSDTYEGSIDGNEFDITGGNPIFVPRIGARYKLKNGKHLGATFSYITGYENDLTFPTQEEVIPLEINVEAFTFGLSFYF